MLPTSLVQVEFGDDFDQPLGGVAFPDSLKEIKLSQKYRHPIDIRQPMFARFTRITVGDVHFNMK